jgi:hypothetical protein
LPSEKEKDKELLERRKITGIFESFHTTMRC